MSENFNDYIIPLLYLLGSIGVGVLLETVVLKKLIRNSARTKWKGDDLLLRSFRGIILCWAAIAGLYMALHAGQFPSNVIHIGNKILFSAGALTVAFVTSRMLVGLIRFKSKAANVYPSTSIISNIVRISVYVIAGLVILQTLGISVTPVLTALGVGALAVALALQDTLSNLFSGVQVIASRQVRIGDYVKLDTNEEGYVHDITWRNTIIRALSNNYIIVPNSKVASAILVNYYLPEKEMSVVIEVSVSYMSDLEKVEAVTVAAGKEVLKNTTGAVSSFEPFIRYHTFGESSIKFSVILRVKEFTDQYLLKHEFVKKLYALYRENNIEIPFPSRNVFLKSPVQ